MMRCRTIVFAAMAVWFPLFAHGDAGKRALLIGINDYSAARLPRQSRLPAPGRDWPNLDGAVNDVRIMRDLLVSLYGFSPSDIVVLTDERATRAAILEAMRQHLVAPAQKGDVLLFYYSGHGSQVRNSLSSEADRLDESVVPADSRRGAEDIRDKELRTPFNKILDRGAHLTVVLDACHSGSGARGMDGARTPRGVKPDPRDIADPTDGARPEERGAVVLSAAQDFDLAYEVIDQQREIHGAFSWALARAIRDGEPGEPLADTFLRVQARLRAEMPAQQPVLAGRDDVRLTPFLGAQAGRRGRRSAIPIEKVLPNGNYVLHGGWVDGLTVGSELRADGVVLEVTSLNGITGAIARAVTGASRQSVRSAPGTVADIIRWAAPPSKPLRVWIPRSSHDPLREALAFRAGAAKRGVHWIDDPTDETPGNLLRWRDDAWELVTEDRTTLRGGDLLRHVRRGASLFVQLPASAGLAKEIGTADGIELADGPASADYVLVGRLHQKALEYAWVRPLVSGCDHARSTLPLRSAWKAAGAGETVLALKDHLLRLRRVFGWNELAAPQSVPHYRLAVRHAGDEALISDGVLVGHDHYRLVLRAEPANGGKPLYARYVYAFVIDSHGESVLLFPPHDRGSVENLLPVTTTPGQPIAAPPEEIPLDGSLFVVKPPYGIDSYFILTTDEPLATPECLEWDGVRLARPPGGPLERLLALGVTGTRGPVQPVRATPNWTLEKVRFTSVPSRRSSR